MYEIHEKSASNQSWQTGHTIPWRQSPLVRFRVFRACRGWCFWCRRL